MSNKISLEVILNEYKALLAKLNVKMPEYKKDR